MATSPATPDSPDVSFAVRSPRTTRSRTGDGSGVNAGGVLRSEWLKLRSVRINLLVLAAACAALLLVGIAISGSTGGVWSQLGDVPVDAASAPLQGVEVASLIIGVLGVLVITNEYGTGLIGTTMIAVPARLPVLGAKATVLVLVTLPALLAATVLSFIAGEALISTGSVHPASWGSPGVLRAVIGTGAYLTGIAVLGLALGTLLRSSAAGISAVVVVTVLLPGLGTLLPLRWSNELLQYLPSTAGSAFTSVTPVPELLSPGAGALVLLIWVAVALVLAAVTLRHRNV